MLYSGLGFSGVLPLVLGASYVTSTIIANMISSVLIDRIGRVNLLVFGLTGCMIALCCEAAITASFGGTTNAAGLKAGVFFFFLYVFMYVSIPKICAKFSKLTSAPLLAMACALTLPDLSTLQRSSQHTSALRAWDFPSRSCSSQPFRISALERLLLTILVGSSTSFSSASLRLTFQSFTSRSLRLVDPLHLQGRPLLIH